MRKIILLCLLALVLASGRLAQAQTPGTGKFTVQFEQNDTNVPAVAGVIKLRRAPFAINLSLPKPMAVLIAASSDPARYDLARQGAPLDRFIPPGTGMAEYPFNESKDLCVSEDGTNYWYYQNERDHRFDRILLAKERIICHRTIENLFFADAGNRSVKLSASDVKRIYLVFVNADYNWETSKYAEHQRETLVLEFVD